jgi:hypothetical protein
MIPVTRVRYPIRLPNQRPLSPRIKVSYPKRMTIAAGLLCKEGVLLCTDTEVTDWETKSQESKMYMFDFPGGKVCFAYAGNTRFAFSAIQKCEKKLRAQKSAKKAKGDPYDEIEEILDGEYRRNVLRHPSQSTDISLHYWLLMALWIEGNGSKLYVSSQTALNESTDFECEGSGKQLARHLLRPWFRGRMPYSEALCQAAYALTHVKDTVQYCDGLSVFRFIDHDGNVSFTTSQEGFASTCGEIERYAKGYDMLTKRLLEYIFDPMKDEQYFEQNLKVLFTDDLRHMFSEIVANRDTHRTTLAKMNPHLSPSQVRKLAAQWSMGIVQAPPPSPASPEESGES